MRGTIQIFPDAHAAARAGAESFVRHARAAVAETGRFSAALSGGSTPREMYALLATEPFRSRVPWQEVHLFWGDERCVPPAHPRSNFGMAYDAFIAHVPIPPENVHRMRGELPPERGATEYEAELTAYFGAGTPRFDLIHLGIGDDAHTASLFPFDLGVLMEQARRVRTALFRPLGEYRLTLTVPVLNAAARVEFLVLGAEKAPVVRSVVRGALDPFRLPAQLVRPERSAAVWILDACAAADVENLATDDDPAPAVPVIDRATAALEADARRLARAEHADPFRVLGLHARAGGGLVVRAFLPTVRAAAVVPNADGAAVPMRCVADTDLFEAVFPDATERFAYRLRVEQEDGTTREIDDPYRFGSTLGDFDLYLFGEGTDLRMYDKLGAHPCVLDGVRGTRFAVWAPNAARVSIVGDFNQWDGRRYPMRLHPGAGIWEIFLPEVHAGALYKYEIKPRHGAPFLKSDPVAFQAELRPGTASVVCERGGYAWGDGEWMARRAAEPLDRPFAVYEVHLGSWRRGDGDRRLSYRELAHALGDYVIDMGFTHVELMPVAEHPYDPSWGYQVTGYFAPTSRYGAPDDFRYLVDHLHRRGIGVLLDWVPAHFPRDSAALRRFDGTALYEHEDPRRGEHPDWGTLIFNYGRNEVRNFLIANALFWLEEYHIDGLRVDAVASMLYLDYSREHGEWIPNPHGGRENLEAIDFLHQLNETVHERAPGALMIAEESTAWPGVTQPARLGGLGFDLKWNMGWMNDFLRFIEHDPIHRRYEIGLLTFSLMYAFSERFVLPLSHDEVVHGKGSLLGKMPGDDWQKFANLRLALGFMWGHPGKKLLFMGGEFGQWSEWSESRSLDWHLLEYPLHAGLQRWVRDLNALYRREPALWACDFTPQGFAWIDFHDVENSVVSFRRIAPGHAEIVFVFNFTPVPRHGYRIGVPRDGWYRELLNSDAAIYGGSNLGNAGGVAAEPVAEHGLDHSLCLALPPLGMLVLACDTSSPESLLHPAMSGE